MSFWSQFLQVMYLLKRFSRRHLFAVLMFALGVWILLEVPQVKNLWFQAPVNTLRRIEYALSAVLLFWFYLTSIATVIPWDPTIASRPSLTGRIFWKPTEWSAGWLPTP